MVKPNIIYVDATPKGRVGVVFSRDDIPESRVVSIKAGLTNNEAEYMGAIRAFNYMSPDQDWIVYMDSALVVNQVMGTWKCKSANLRPYLRRVLEYLDNFPANVEFKWINRDNNPAGVLLEKFKDIENGLDKELAKELARQTPVRNYAETLYKELQR